MDDAVKKLGITVRGALMILTLRMMMDDNDDVVSKYYISREEAQHRIDLLGGRPMDEVI